MKNTISIDKDLKKILIIGANGFLGRNVLQFQNIKQIKDQNFLFIAADLENTNIEKKIPFFHIDITKAEDTKKKIMKISPNIILLTAAMTNVDQNEIEKAHARKINIQGPKNVLKACKKTNSKIVFMSTDFVFDGTKTGLYNEKDIPNPLNYYAKTKYEAELALINSDIEYLICRTAVLYGWNKEKYNFISWIIDKLQKNERISIVTTQINNPTFVRNLAEILIKLMEKDAKGIYHTAGSESLNRYEMAIRTAEVFEMQKDLIIPIKYYEQKATRPENASLDISKLKNLIGSELKIYGFNEGLNYMKNHKP